jgi:hypothetical protein
MLWKGLGPALCNRSVTQAQCRIGVTSSRSAVEYGFRFNPKSSRGLDFERAAKVLKADPHLPGAFDFTNAAIASVSGSVALGGVAHGFELQFACRHWP